MAKRQTKAERQADAAIARSKQPTSHLAAALRALVTALAVGALAAAWWVVVVAYS